MSSLGRVLTDGQGRTLYLFEADEPNVSKLSTAGLSVWPPLLATGKPQAKRGALAAKIGTVTGADGKPQVTYDRHPLYYYIGDTKPGQTKGQALNQFGAEWYVLAPSGNKIDIHQQCRCCRFARADVTVPRSTQPWGKPRGDERMSRGQLGELAEICRAGGWSEADAAVPIARQLQSALWGTPRHGCGIVGWRRGAGCPRG